MKNSKVLEYLVTCGKLNTNKFDKLSFYVDKWNWDLSKVVSMKNCLVTFIEVLEVLIDRNLSDDMWEEIGFMTDMILDIHRDSTDINILLKLLEKSTRFDIVTSPNKRCTDILYINNKKYTVSKLYSGNVVLRGTDNNEQYGQVLGIIRDQHKHDRIIIGRSPEQRIRFELFEPFRYKIQL